MIWFASHSGRHGARRTLYPTGTRSDLETGQSQEALVAGHCSIFARLTKNRCSATSFGEQALQAVESSFEEQTAC
jgi:hypothetical protein